MPLYEIEPIDESLQAISNLDPSEGDLLRFGPNGWEAVKLAALDIPQIDADQIASGKIANDRINWESPGAIGEVTPSRLVCSEFELRTAVDGLIRNYVRNVSDTICGAEFYLSAGPGLDQAITIGLYRYLYSRIDNRSGGPFLISSGPTTSAIFYPSGGASIGAALSDPGANNLRVQGVVGLGSFTRMTVPSAVAHPGGLIYISDESLGATPAFSDGASWRRIHDRMEVA